MSILIVRPDDWNFPLLLHVAGAMLLVGVLLTVAGTLLLAARGREPGDAAVLTRFAFRTMLFAGLPALVLMRVGAEWTASREGYGGDDDPTWLGIGYGLTDASVLVFLITLIVTGLAGRRLAREPDGRTVLGRVGASLTLLMLIAYTIVVWAMTAKPT